MCGIYVRSYEATNERPIAKLNITPHHYTFLKNIGGKYASLAYGGMTPLILS